MHGLHLLLRICMLANYMLHVASNICSAFAFAFAQGFIVEATLKHSTHWQTETSSQPMRQVKAAYKFFNIILKASCS